MAFVQHAIFPHANGLASLGAPQTQTTRIRIANKNIDVYELQATNGTDDTYKQKNNNKIQHNDVSLLGGKDGYPTELTVASAG